MLPTKSSLSTIMFALALSPACGGGDSGGTGPSGLTFPALNPGVNAQYCVRGNTTVGQTKSGSVTAQDCDYADLDPSAGGYYEVWRVRVAQAGSITFTVDAPNFDSYLDLVEIEVAAGDVNAVTFLSNDDDTNGDDPVLTYDLVPDTDYAIVVSGFDYPEVGSYTVTIN